MTEEQKQEHLRQMQVAGAIPLTVEEILAGQSQGGVPRPAFLADHEDDGTVQRVNSGVRT